MSTQSSSKAKLGLRFKLIIPLAIMITLSFGMNFLRVRNMLTNVIFGVMDDEISNIMDLTLNCLDGDELEALKRDMVYEPSAPWPDSMSDQRYWEQQYCLDQAVYFNPRALIFTYYEIDENTLAYGLDSEASLDPANSIPFGERITATTDGDYDYMRAGLVDIYPFDEVYYDEKYETNFLGTTAPIKNSAGQTVGGLAVYLEANNVVNNLDQTAYVAIFFAPIVYLLAIGTTFFIVSQATSSLRNLTAASERVAAGDYNPIVLKKRAFGDEVSTLADVFNIMLDKVHTREEKLKQRVKELEIIIDTDKRDQRVQEIVDSEFFQDIQSRAAELRERQKKDND